MKSIRCLRSVVARAGLTVPVLVFCHGLAMSAESTPEGALEEVIVTAERREASLQDVPIAITAFSGEQLDQSGLQTTVDLQYRTPPLSATRLG
jgi:iron complex outermembrane recepter protein